MDITSENFIERLPLITQSIQTADFMAIDSEFSGLSIGFDDKQHDYDTTEDKYQKFKHTIQRMNAFQWGVTTFKWDSKRSKYVMRPFNFYVFPSSTLMDK
jgi:poly(A)-specific ribonuclease